MDYIVGNILRMDYIVGNILGMDYVIGHALRVSGVRFLFFSLWRLLLFGGSVLTFALLYIHGGRSLDRRVAGPRVGRNVLGDEGGDGCDRRSSLLARAVVVRVRVSTVEGVKACPLIIIIAGTENEPLVSV